MRLISLFKKKDKEKKGWSLRTMAIFAAILFVGFLVARHQLSKTHAAHLRIRDVDLTVDIASNPVSQARGLSGRASLAEDQGMLFIFPSLQRPGFWMKEMNFPIDIIWILDDKVIDISRDLPPPKGDDPLPIYYPQGPINRVLEVPAGFADRHNVTVGDPIDYQP